jgi:excisionase family DNA binding protein
MGDFLTVPDFARRIGVKDATVYTAIKEKRVQFTKILGRLAVPKTELRRFKRRTNGIETKIFRKI